MLRIVPLLFPLFLCGCSSSPDREELAAFNEGTRAAPEFDSDLLELFTTADDEEYTLGAGDLIFVNVWGQPELSGPHVIGPDGVITLPTVGPMKCEGLTRNAAADLLGEALSRVYSNVSATVRVDEYRSANVSILGGVMTPGAYPYLASPTLLRAIADAGGLAELATGLSPNRASIVRGSNKMVSIDLDELLVRGNTRLNITLQRDDIVFVRDSGDSVVYVLGEVKNPGVYRLTPGMSLVDAIAVAGGPTINGQPEELLLIRPAEDTQVEIDFDHYLAGRYELDVELRTNDVLFVPMSGLGKFGYVLHQVSPFSSVVVAN